MHCARRIVITASCKSSKILQQNRCGLIAAQTYCMHKHSLSAHKININSCNKKNNSANISEIKDIISVETNNETLKFPSIWLRDNCQCPMCFHKDSQSRTIDWGQFDFDVKPLSAKLETSNLTVEWSDSHKSTFPLDWLMERCFTEEKRKNYRENVYGLKKVSWGAKEFESCLKKFDYGTVMKDNSVLLKWLESLAIYGVAMVDNVPADRESCIKLTQRVAFLRKTHYGEEFIVTEKDGTTNVAYLSAPLQLHTDLPYYHYKPGTNLLHCLVQAQGEGGESQLTDCLWVGNYLKENNPETYKVLTNTFVDWNDIGQENGNHFHSIHRAPVLCEDDYGDIVRVNFSQPQRDSHFNVPLDQVAPWYKAVGIFTKLLHSLDNTVLFKLKEGEILTFDNLRLVHGRTGYNDCIGKERYIVGCYLDWDEIYSRIRVLRKALRESM